MSYVYPPRPAYEPSGPYLDGMGVDATFTADSLVLTMADGNEAIIPYRNIKKHSIKVQRGSDSDLNQLTITLFGGQFTFTDDSPAEGWIEIVAPKKVTVE